MTLRLTHFDTKIRQDLDVQDHINNTIAEYLFPETEFALGMVYSEGTTATDLREYEGKTLQFTSGDRMYFAKEPVRELLYPNPSDGAAYGSLVFTPNQQFSEQHHVRILVVDDSVENLGQNGGLIPIDEAKNLVGDCHGKISRELANELTGKKDTPFQFRLGIKPQSGNDVYRIGKGTLAPSNLESLGQPLLKKLNSGETQVKVGYDLVLPLSSFKGRFGADAIKTGEYNLTIGLGVKALAEYGQHSLGTQVLVNYPRGVKHNILSELEEQAKDLARIQSDPRALAQQYIEKYERRVQLTNQTSPSTEQDEVDDLEDLNFAIDEAEGDEETESTALNKQELLLYRLLKSDVEGHLQILDHPKIIDSLNKFVRHEWVDIATGRAIKFNSGLAQPSWELGMNEICVPFLPSGEEVIVTRSPLVNSNGVIVLNNRHLPGMENQQGTVHIHPTTAAKHLQADFDGDRLAFELASNYPILAAEVKEYNLPENRYPDVVKPNKVAYSGSFESIALSARANKIGLIANQIQHAVAMQWETQLLPLENQPEYLNKISSHYKQLLKDDANPNKGLQLPTHFKEKVLGIANLPKKLTPEEITQSLGSVKQILFDVVSKLSNELQVAVDGPKSAARPNAAVLEYALALSGYAPVSWLADKKNPSAFLDRPIKSSNYSPVDLMVQQATKFFEQSQLIARPLVQFRPMFSGIGFSEKQSAEATSITAAYNQLIKAAIDLDETAKKGSGPTLTATSLASGKQIEITNLLKYAPPDSPVWSDSSLDIKLFDNDDDALPNTLKAVIVKDVDGKPTYQTIGVVTETSVKQHNLKPGIRLAQASVTLTPGATSNQVKAKFQSAAQYLESVRNRTPSDEQLPLAAAIWHANHGRSGDKDSFKKAGVAFNAFPELVVKQLSDLQFTNLKVVGVHQPTNELRGRKWNQELVQCALAVETNPSSPIYGRRIVTVEGKTLAPLSSESPVLPQGTKFEAEIVSAPATVVATTPKGNSLKITNSEGHDFADYQWNGETTLIEIGFIPNPNSAKSSIPLPMLPIAKIGNRVLGEFDSESVLKLTDAKVLKPGVTLKTNLKTTVATTAQIKVDAQSILYPYQQSIAYNPTLAHSHGQEKLSQSSIGHISPVQGKPQKNSDIDTLTPLEQPAVTHMARLDNLNKVSTRSQWPTTNKLPTPENWMSVAQAIGRSPEYVDRVMMVTQPGLPLSLRANTAMQQDFSLFFDSNATLQQWFRAAEAIGKPPSYLDRIAQVALAFNEELQPTPLSPEVFSAIQRDLSAHEKLLQMSVVQNLSNCEPKAIYQNVQKSHALDQSLMESESRAISIAAEIMLSMVGVRSGNGDITFSSDNYSFKQQFTETGSKISIQANIDAHLVMSNGKLTSSVLPSDMEAMQLLQNTAAEIVEEKEKLKKNISLRL